MYFLQQVHIIHLLPCMKVSRKVCISKKKAIRMLFFYFMFNPLIKMFIEKKEYFKS
jgi:hypothetical protein